MAREDYRGIALELIRNLDVGQAMDELQAAEGRGSDAFHLTAIERQERDDERFAAGVKHGRALEARNHFSSGQTLGLVAAQAKVLDLHQECGDHYCEFHSGKEEEFAHECQTCDSIDRLRAAKAELGELLLTLSDNEAKAAEEALGQGTKAAEEAKGET
jgi:hypothetical protein